MILNKAITSIDYCAGIVTYNPNIERLNQNVNELLKEFSQIVIVDNGSENFETFKKDISKNELIAFIRNDKNEGIAKALNQIFVWAKQNKYAWVLTMDQDSICSNGYLKEMIPYLEKKSTGIICPKIIYEGIDLVQESTGDFGLVDACMTSGSLTSVSAWEICGGFDEWMFIDLVDNDFCMRLKLKNYIIVRVNSAILYHHLGNQKTVKLPFKRKIITFNHSTFRNYYYVRNSLYFIRKYRRHSRTIHLILVLIYWESIKLIFEKHRIKTFYSILRGIKDGLFAKI